MRLIAFICIASALAACNPNVSTSNDSKTIRIDPAAVAAPSPAVASDWVTQYLIDAAKADAIEDHEQRCLRYPDIPGMSWDASTLAARCAVLRAPALSLDQIESELDRRDGHLALETKYRALLENGNQDAASGDRMFRAFDEFAQYGRAADLAREWLKRAPDSAFAHLAVATQTLYEAHQARGGGTQNEISEERKQYFSSLAREALTHFIAADKIEPALTPACSNGARAALLAGDRPTQNQLIERCIRVDPFSFEVTSEWAFAADPRWGGSKEDLVRVREHVEKSLPKNPALASVLVSIDTKGLISRVSDVASVSARFETALKRAPNALALSRLAIAAYERGEHTLAMAYASQAFRFDPKNEEHLDARIFYASALKRFDLVIEDRLRRFALHPYRLRTPHEINAAKIWAAMANKAPIPESTPEQRSALTASLFAGHCMEDQVLLNPHGRDARECVSEQLQRYGDSAYSWLTAAEWKIRTRQDASKEIAEFLKRADPDDAFLAPSVRRFKRMPAAEARP